MKSKNELTVSGKQDTDNNIITCPLCKNKDAKFFCNDKVRDYFRCDICDLTFVLPENYLNSEAEKSRYDFHENSMIKNHITLYKSLFYI